MKGNTNQTSLKGNKWLKILALIVLLLITLSIRVWHLEDNPAGFFCDEASAGYDAYLIATTGKDRHKETFPLFFKGFNFDNVSPFHVYMTVPFVSILGLNEFAVRLVPVFWSTLEVFIFFLVLRLFIPFRFALLGMAFLSFSPWHYHLTRISVGEYYSWTLLTLVSYYFLSLLLRKAKNIYSLFGAALFFGLASYSYTPARLTTPLLAGIAVLLIALQKQYRQAGVFLILYSFVMIPFIHFHLTDPHSFQRIKDTMGIDLHQQQDLPKLDGNRIVSKYLSHYSYGFLFQYGDADYPGQFIKRHSIAGLGLLFPYQLPLILLGTGLSIWYIRKGTSRFELLFLLAMLVLFPLADSLTLDRTPFATRSYLGVIPFNILSAFGAYALFLLIKKCVPRLKKQAAQLVLLPLTIAVFFSLIILLQHARMNPYITSDFWGWQFGARDVIAYFKTHRNEYDELYLQPEFNAPQIFLLFYDKEHFCTNCFIGTLKEMYSPNKRQLFAVTPSILQESSLPLTTVDRIYFPDGTVAFFLVATQESETRDFK